MPLDGGYVPSEPDCAAVADIIPDEGTTELPLARLAYARSGDKGDTSNIAIIARKPRDDAFWGQFSPPPNAFLMTNSRHSGPAPQTAPQRPSAS